MTEPSGIDEDENPKGGGDNVNEIRNLLTDCVVLSRGRD